jgi:hypothetical protein
MNMFRDHFERVSAQRAGALPVAPAYAPSHATGHAPEPTGEVSAYRLLLVALGEDLRALSNIQSVERKIEAKRQMIERYRPWITGALAAKSGTQDEIVATMLVWSIDIAEWPLALDLAEHVLTKRMRCPNAIGARRARWWPRNSRRPGCAPNRPSIWDR